jgi:hypothetical protein
MIPGAYPHYPPQADTSINRTLFSSTSHVTRGVSQSIATKVNYVWTTCKSALGLLDDLIRPRWAVCTSDAALLRETLEI